VLRRGLLKLRGSASEPEAEEDKDQRNDNLAKEATPVSLVDDVTLGGTGSARACAAGASDKVLGIVVHLVLSRHIAVLGIINFLVRGEFLS